MLSVASTLSTGALISRPTSRGGAPPSFSFSRPPRAGELGVYVGGANREIRDLAVEIARPWAHPDKLIPVDSGAAAATGARSGCR